MYELSEYLCSLPKLPANFCNIFSFVFKNEMSFKPKYLRFFGGKGYNKLTEHQLNISFNEHTLHYLIRTNYNSNQIIKYKSFFLNLFIYSYIMSIPMK